MKTSLKRVLPVLAVSVLLGACSSLNPFSSSAPKPAALVDLKPTAELRTLWRTSVGKSGAYVFHPAVAGDSVFAAGADGRVLRIDGGREAWRADAKTTLSAGVGSDGRLAVVVSADGVAIAYDAATGSERWRSPLGAEVLAPPAVNADVVVLRASDNRLIALDPSDGSRRWVYQRTNPPLALRSYAGVLLESGVALAGFPGGKLVAISLANGGALWELSVAAPRGATELERIADVAGLPVVGRREVCAVTYQGRVACFDGSNGNALWARDFSSSVGMDRDNRFVVITDDKDAVHALDVYSGASVWKQDALARRGVSRPLFVGDHVAVGDVEGHVHLLGREDGAFAARSRADSSAITADLRRLGSGFVVQTRGGDVVAYEVR
ncbi:outer membrane protein assembly factor BamB [Azoarcus communis]|uniref:Outer membrane protein assembly factor BamB n=1 Tax=Parazoarcus communis SWub3 = DSM 12120 TaxID=1121029 RepID=A0A323UYL7_9RHOO|nr:outer membrane protein assembly factor BamB [Parazoarcus communis]NMG48900.1 outer membrane protein assembly factor BamB [Parazoarcus communis]NMG71736.1 outer membrane protein assembly factor BamB [Parazoarcus communis SWub3 = DSM 12120]PZA17321.1 outer membrane protein assembly factor BamB [Azoarcus communis] [Parazoarcus communis SWub3 = DSM 12120]